MHVRCSCSASKNNKRRLGAVQRLPLPSGCDVIYRSTEVQPFESSTTHGTWPYLHRFHARLERTFDSHSTTTYHLLDLRTDTKHDSMILLGVLHGFTCETRETARQTYTVHTPL